MEEVNKERLIALGDPWVSRINGGLPTLPISELPDAETIAPFDEPVRLVDDAGETIGIGLPEPNNGLFRVLPCHDVDTPLDRSFFVARLERALELRRRLGLVDEEGAFRLVNSEGDELSGFLVDVYAGHVLIHTLAPDHREIVTLLADAIREVLGPKSIIAKVRPKGDISTGSIPFDVLSDEPPPKRIEVTEDGVRYEVHLTGGLNTGLFLDMRETRRELRRWCAGKRILNTFCYTGSLSVTAILAGAAHVTSVDFASGVLQWTKTNARLNGIADDDRRLKYVRADVFDHLKTSRRRDQRFDVVILDPPTKTTVPGRRWYLKSDYDRLVGHALPLLAPGGLLIAAVSSLQSRPEKVEQQLRAAAREQGRRLRLVATPGLPPDFPTQMIHPEGRTLKCYFLLVD
ncbi:Ribosomal RNA large subunit methyltransferase I [Planctomycetes bacterium Pan216]|uniref:Ribosomal RNA large subunit methyltransferase I n=1 Tax=Kolteria novifilia TaxID=2527975 RepID=A0A518B680_9BACT|nr:Ribosomal RNA large subunit methyltransferase I [Planctomycetes bacterium Pan216]